MPCTFLLPDALWTGTIHMQLNFYGVSPIIYDPIYIYIYTHTGQINILDTHHTCIYWIRTQNSEDRVSKTVYKTLENECVFTENIIREIFITQHAVDVTAADVIRQGSFLFTWVCGPARARASTFLRFLYHTQRRTTVGSTPLEEWSAWQTDLYLTTRNTHNRHPCFPMGFEPSNPKSKRPPTYA
jgi:hypothetical protein